MNQAKINGKWLPKTKPVFAIKYNGKYMAKSGKAGKILLTNDVWSSALYSFESIQKMKRFNPEVVHEKFEIILVGFTASLLEMSVEKL